MNRIRRICFSWGAVVFLGVLSMVFVGLALWPLIPTHVAAVEDTAPSVTASATPSPKSTTTSSPSATLSPKPATTPTTQVSTATTADPKGKPIRMSIFQDDKQLIGMGVEKDGNADPHDFQSQCGMTTWYSAEGWPKPGAESLQRSLITGHMQCRGATYSINNLKESRHGATLKVTFDSGCVVVARAVIPATGIAKPQLNKRDELLYNQELARIIRVSTCDDEAKKDAEGHSTKNYYQMFEVVSVTCPSSS